MNSISLPVIIFVNLALIVISLNTILNALLFPRLRSTAENHQSAFRPLLSIMIPARNEATVIQTTIASLLTQDYDYFELIVLDDDSTDATADLIRSFTDSRLMMLTGEPLPAGWLGKNRACHRMAQIAQGDYLIFTDADVQWSPGALRALVDQLERTDADLLTVWPTQQTITWSERLVVPLMALAIIGYLPIIGTHYTPWSIFAAACGQCMVWKRSAYRQVGGHQAVAGNVLEDVTMARVVKRQQMRLRMVDGAGLITCRMYRDWNSVRNGYAKNILAGYGNSVPVLLLATVFHWLIFILPPVMLLISGPSSLWLGLTIPGIGIRMLSAIVTRQRLIDGLLMPASALLMTVIAFQAIYWHYHGGSRWKGRSITPQPSAKKQPGPGNKTWIKHHKTSSS